MSIQTYDVLPDGDRAAVLSLTEQARRSDGSSPLSESALLRVHSRTAVPGVWQQVLREQGTVLGYAGLDARADDEPASVELFVAPKARRQGHGAQLLQAVARQAEGLAAGYAVWAHGQLPAAAALARSAGMSRSRVLWQLRRSLPLEPDNPGYADRLPQGVRIRPFVVGQDEEAWLAVNAAAFTDHPEQGRLQRSDLDERLAEDWFDPDGFLLAERVADGELLGFHWTKVHREEDPPAGEVYVVGVSPAAQGMRLGVVLTVAGLDYLAGRGLRTALLYVDDGNPRAVALYRHLGFTDYATDIMYTPEAGEGEA